MILFCEYAFVSGEAQNDFAEWAVSSPDRWGSAELLASEVQPGLFVEIWRGLDEQSAERIRRERLEEHSEWREMDKWVKGGREGLRMWTFRPFDYRRPPVPPVPNGSV
ncbi:hypothetical protein ACFPVX_16490 [Cohnella faecalis]|uniref:NIPSNAP domain-containing protein n=1 Tax=Cohnella faecalis TaxID=2315694 RepID=A0A398CKC2_9BACL|nr:hypothetical protein [Cohnella faecalis]RIE02750.1 hypothetical protein D3H35_19085 [Cohnella faecalis]